MPSNAYAWALPCTQTLYHLPDVWSTAGHSVESQEDLGKILNPYVSSSVNWHQWSMLCSLQDTVGKLRTEIQKKIKNAMPVRPVNLHGI